MVIDLGLPVHDEPGEVLLAALAYRGTLTSVIASTDRPMTSPHWTGVPISLFRSITIVLAPFSAAALPAPLPTGPEPTTSTSQFCQSIVTTRT